MYVTVFFYVLKFSYIFNKAPALPCAVLRSDRLVLYPTCLSAGLVVSHSLCSGPANKTVEGQALGGYNLAEEKWGEPC